jgi:hypothetical protein
MSFRFLFLDSDGREIRLTSRAELRRAVQVGDLSEDMLLYDAETSEWSPARTHPLVHAMLEGEEEPGGDTPASGRKAVDKINPGDISGLTLTSPESEAPDPDDEPEAEEGVEEDETVRAFRERLERERRRQESLGPGVVSDGLSMKRGDRIADLDDPNAPKQSLPRAVPVPEPPRVDSGVEPVEAAPIPKPIETTEPIEAMDMPAWSATAELPRRPAPGTRRRRARPGQSAVSRTIERGLSPQAAVLALLIGVLGWGIADALATSADPPTESGATMVGELALPEPAPEPVDEALDLSASTYVAFADMQRGMERLGQRLGVAEPPTDWLSGRYLADAATLPQVRDFWVRYGAFVDSVRVREEELFRAGYLARLRDEGVGGSTLSIRLSGALQDFRADRARREQIYRTMDALAAEALIMDQWLRETSDRIAYAGVRGGAVSLAPEIEAAPLDDETRRELDLRLNRILDALDRVTGPDPTRARAITGRIVAEPPPAQPDEPPGGDGG